MKVRHFVTLFALSVFSGIAIAQRATHPEAKTPEAKPPAPAAATHSESSPAEHKPAPPSHSAALAARFQAVAASLKLSNRQQKSIANLIQSAHKELAKIRSDQSLTPQQRQKAEQAVNLTLAQQFVGLLTPQQKKDLEAVLLKQKQKGLTANTNSAANSGGSDGGSSPDIPSIDAPSGGDAGNSDNSSSASNSSTASSSSSSADAPASADASKSSSTPSSTSDSTSASGTATAATSSTTVAAMPAGAMTSKVSPPSPAPAKKGRLSDAQLAAILDSFVQDEDESEGSAAKPSAHSGPGSGS